MIAQLKTFPIQPGSNRDNVQMDGVQATGTQAFWIAGCGAIGPPLVGRVNLEASCTSGDGGLRSHHFKNSFNANYILIKEYARFD